MKKKHIHPSYLEVYNQLKRTQINIVTKIISLQLCRMYKEQGSRKESNRATSFPLESGISDRSIISDGTQRRSWVKPSTFAGRVSLSHATTFIHWDAKDWGELGQDITCNICKLDMDSFITLLHTYRHIYTHTDLQMGQLRLEELPIHPFAKVRLARWPEFFLPHHVYLFPADRR